jgi:hypothetical protein
MSISNSIGHTLLALLGVSLQLRSLVFAELLML